MGYKHRLGIEQGLGISVHPEVNLGLARTRTYTPGLQTLARHGSGRRYGIRYSTEDRAWF